MHPGILEVAPVAWSSGVDRRFELWLSVRYLRHSPPSRALAPRHGSMAARREWATTDSNRTPTSSRRWLTTRGASQVASQRAEHRGWLSHGLAALAISALGLAVAGSVSLTTSAQPLAAPVPAANTVQTDPAGSAVSGAALSGATVPGARSEAETASADPSLAAFTRPEAVDDSSRSVRLQAAVVKERAAQRAEDLAKSAEETTQAAREAGGAARSQELATSERATRQAAVKIAQERLAAAVRKRVAAETERQGIENTDTSTSTTTTHDPRHRHDHHGPDRRWQLVPGSGRRHRCPLRPVRPVVALPHRTRLPRRLRHPHQGGGERRGGLRRQQRRLGR